MIAFKPYIFWILLRISDVIHCTLRELRKNALNPGQDIVNILLKLMK